MVNEYSLPRISVISSYNIASKTLIISIFCKRRSSYISKDNEINTAIVSQTLEYWILQ